MQTLRLARLTWVGLPMLVLAVGLCFSGPAPSSVQQGVGRNYALLVACQEYDEKELLSLLYARNDILEFHKVLLDSGFNKDDIVLLHDKQEATKLRPLAKNIRKQLEVLLAGLRPQDTLVVAFAGHGVQFQGNKKHYFCPQDAELKDLSTLVALDEVYKQLANCKAKRKLLLVDACRKDPQSKLSRNRPEVNLESVTRPQVDPVPEGVVALFSCSAGQEAFEYPALKHGIFFYHVLKGWEGAAANKVGEVTLGGLAEYVQVETPRYARLKLDVVQVPQLKNDFSGIWTLRKLSSAKVALAKPLERDREKLRDGEAYLDGFGALSPLLGLAEDSKELTALKRHLGVPKISKFENPTCHYYIWPEHGLDVFFNREKVALSVFLYAEGADKHKQFKGKLPHGITFADTQQTVEKKLGKPEKASELGGPSWAIQGGLRWQILYVSTERDSPIQSVVIFMLKKVE